MGPQERGLQCFGDHVVLSLSVFHEGYYVLCEASAVHAYHTMSLPLQAAGEHVASINDY